MDLELIKNVSLTHVSISYKQGIKLATLNADLISFFWWISRVNVPEGLRGKGIGSKLLQEALKEMKKCPASKAIIVYPGGYDSDPEKQANFYVKNGFKPGQAAGEYRIDL
jgi:GNAT superfamily N-acetyltransferase